MDITILTAKIFAIYVIVAGLSLVFRRKTISLVLRDFLSHPGIMYVTGAFMVFIGGFLVLKHNIWEGSLAIFVSILAWLILLKGILYMFTPGWLIKMGRNVSSWARPAGIVLVLLGVWLLFSI